MKHLIVALLLFLCSAQLLSQEERKFITGEIKLDSFPIHNVHILNITTNTGTVSNELGMFILLVKLGDRLSISHLNLKNLIISITKEHVDALAISVEFTEQATLLREFTLQKTRGIFDQDKDILRDTGPTVNAQTLKLPDTKISTDAAVFKIKSGAVISLNNLVSVLNGSKKRAKALGKLSFEDRQLVRIRNFFTDDFFITDLQIQEKYINSFLNFCVKKNIIQFFNKKENLRLTKIFLRESNLFAQEDSSLIKVAFKKQ